MTSRFGAPRPLRLRGRNAGAGSSGPPVDFAADGFSAMFWNSAGYTGVYSERTDKLWMIWEGSYRNDSDTLVRRYHVRTRDMTTGEISPIIPVANTPSAANYHGPPAILELPAPATGHFLVAGGANNGSGFPFYVTETVDNPFSWRPLGTVGTSRTYAKLVTNGSKVVLVCSQQDVPGTSFRGLGVQVSTSVAADGTVTWGTQVCVHNPLDGRAYQGLPKIDPADSNSLLIAWCRGNLAESQRVDVYFARYNLTTGDVTSFDGSTTVLAAALPMDNATAADFIIFNQDETSGLINTVAPTMHFDAAGGLHIGWSDGAEPTMTAKHSFWNGSSWVTTNLGTMIGRYDGVNVTDGPDGGVLAMWQPSPNGVKRTAWGKQRDAAGSWGPDFLIWEDAREISGPSQLHPTHPDAVAAFHQYPLESVSTAEDGTLKGRVIKNDGTFLPWIKTGYTYLNAETAAYDARRAVPLAAVHADLPAFADRLMTVLKDIGLSKFEAYYPLGFSLVDNDDWLEDFLHSNNKLIRVGSPQFVAKKGFQGNGVDMALVSPINFSDSLIATQNSSHIGSETLSGGGDGVPSIGATINGGLQSYLLPLTGASNVFCRMNHTANGVSLGGTTGNRSMVGQRTSSSAISIYGEGANLGATGTAGTSSGRPAAPVALNRFGSSSLTYGTYLIFSAHWGSALTAGEISHLYYGGQLPLRRLLTP